MRKILYQPWGGLGDNLQYSTLPEKFSKLGFETYISSMNVYRNNEIYDLVWKCNPFIKGISTERYNIGSCGNYNCFSNKGIIFNQEIAHGLEPENEIPKIYYTPKHIPELSSSIFVDISGYSTKPNDDICYQDYITHNFKNHNIIIPEFNENVNYSNKINNFSYTKTMKIDSIFQYCDVINSCKHFVCFFSGQSVLASAINKNNVICFIPKKLFGNSDYCLKNINYETI